MFWTDGAHYIRCLWAHSNGKLSFQWENPQTDTRSNKLRPTSRAIARVQRRRTKAKETQQKKQKVERAATCKPEMSIDAMGGSGPSSSGDSIHVPIPDFLMEAMYEQALSIPGDVQEDPGFQSPELSPELKEMFRLFTNVDVD